MMKKLFSAIGVMAAGLALAGTVQAQVFTPTFQSPRLVNELGFHVSDGPGSMAFAGIWRGGPLGLRVGYVDAAGGLISIGGELRNALPVQGAPLGLAFTAGAQGLLGDATAVGVQAGLSAGYTFRGTGMAVTPYLHPRLGMVRTLGGPENLELRLLADVGADAELYNNLIIRFGVKLDDLGSNFGFGIGIRQ
jgi:hypothetical protein